MSKSVGDSLSKVVVGTDRAGKVFTAVKGCNFHECQGICFWRELLKQPLGWTGGRGKEVGYLPDDKTYNSVLRKPIERDRSGDAQLALNRRVSPLILRCTKDQLAADLPPKTELIHHVELTRKQIDL